MINKNDEKLVVKCLFLSSSELSFYRVLQQAIYGETVIFTKVSLSDIFFVKRPDKNTAYHNKIARKHVDFLLCSTDTLVPAAGIELDDTSHERADRVKRDKFVNDVCETAGLPLIRFKNKTAMQLMKLKRRLKLQSIKRKKTLMKRTQKMRCLLQVNLMCLYALIAGYPWY